MPPTADGESISFGGAVDEFKRHCLLHGLDDIGLTSLKADKISAFEDNPNLSRSPNASPDHNSLCLLGSSQ